MRTTSGFHYQSASSVLIAKHFPSFFEPEGKILCIDISNCMGAPPLRSKLPNHVVCRFDKPHHSTSKFYHDVVASTSYNQPCNSIRSSALFRRLAVVFKLLVRGCRKPERKITYRQTLVLCATATGKVLYTSSQQQWVFHFSSLDSAGR